MVKIVIGDLFQSTAQTLVNTVNCVGIMGKGVALGFKQHFPDMYEDYAARCKAGEVKLGHPYLYRRVTSPWILNFPTKDHWRSVSRLQDIVQGLEHLERHYQDWGITSLAVPPLGCGEGQLEWRVVGPTLYRYLRRLSIPVELYAPYGTPNEEMQPAFLEQAASGKVVPRPSDVRMHPGWVALVDVLARIEHEPYHHPVGRTTFQKIAYFATQAGLPTQLQYRRGSYGPYSPELKALVTRLVNHGLIREERLGRMFAVKVGPTFRDARKAYQQDLQEWDHTINRIADLFMRLDTHQAELVATVHFAAKVFLENQGAEPDEKDVLNEVLKWKQKRRPRLSEGDLALAIRNLGALRWLNVRPNQDLPVAEEALA